MLGHKKGQGDSNLNPPYRGKQNAQNKVDTKLEEIFAYEGKIPEEKKNKNEIVTRLGQKHKVLSLL